jgi:hypothetical protein
MRGGDARTEGLDPNARRTGSESLLDGNLEKVIGKPKVRKALQASSLGFSSGDGSGLNIRSAS